MTVDVVHLIEKRQRVRVSVGSAAASTRVSLVPSTDSKIRERATNTGGLSPSMHLDPPWQAGGVFLCVCFV